MPDELTNREIASNSTVAVLVTPAAAPTWQNKHHWGFGDVPQEQDRALALYRRACEGGYDDVCRGVEERSRAPERQVISEDDPETSP